jgi:hypothetical protein
MAKPIRGETRIDQQRHVNAVLLFSETAVPAIGDNAVMAVRIRVILAFASIFIVWGSTYLAIRYAVEEIPPLLTGAVRHLVAGAILLFWARSKRSTRDLGGVAAQRGRWRALLSHWSRDPALGGTDVPSGRTAPRGRGGLSSGVDRYRPPVLDWRGGGGAIHNAGRPRSAPGWNSDREVHHDQSFSSGDSGMRLVRGAWRHTS